MKTKLLYYWGLLQTSFWFVPLIIVTFAIMLAFGLIYLDSTIHYKPSGVFVFVFSGGVDSARSVLSTIAGAMLGVTSTVFSITLVALALASSQYGSRLVGNFMLDRLNQTVLGIYLATFIFCLIVLRAVKPDNFLDFVPNVSVLFAIIIAIANIFLLIVFIHHIAVSIQADEIISNISVKLDKSLNKLFPKELGEQKDKEKEHQVNELKKTLLFADTVISEQSGYLEVIDNEGLMKMAEQNNLLLTIAYRPGDYLVERIELVKINSRNKCSDETKQKIAGAFILGRKRTSTQDAEFAINQMVEIAARALSPGINDPFTAHTCIDKLTSAMCRLTRENFPSAYRYDKDGALRIIVSRPLTFTGMMDTAFDQIRHYGKNSPTVLMRLMESFIVIHGFARTKEQKNTAEKHARMVYKAAESSHLDTNFLIDLNELYDKLKSQRI